MKEIREEGIEKFGRYYSKYKGIVASNEDPKNLGRIQVIVPQVYGETAYKYWALPSGMYSGKGIGAFFLPNKGDSIWVEFESGDVRFPIWSYGWVREAPKDANPKIKVIQTTTKQRIVMDDDNELIRIEDNHGNKVVLNGEGVSIVSDSISLGSLDGSDEPAVLGDTVVTLLNEMLTDIGNLSAIVTSSGITATVSTSPQWAALVQKWGNKFDTIKSSKVTLN